MTNKTKAIGLMLVVVCALAIVLLTGGDSGLKGVWSCTEVEVAENTYQPVYRTLSFYDVKGNRGNVTLKDKSSNFTATGNFQKNGNTLTLSFDGYGSTDYTITMKGSQAFVLDTGAEKVLFTKQ